jgi:hypothetical protein
MRPPALPIHSTAKQTAWTLGIAAALALNATAVSFQQLDEFEDATVMDWGGNRTGTLTPIADGGPTGTGDGYLEVHVTAFHLGTRNNLQWTGDYLAAGIEAIEMDLNHLAPVIHRINLRILISGPGGTFASQGITADVPTQTWTHAVFGLASNDLVYLENGSGVLEDTLAAIDNLQVRHDSLVPTMPGSHPPHVTATLGIDNIHAVARKSVLGALMHNSSQVDVTLSQLVVGVTNHIQVTGDLEGGAWSNALTFTATTETTNVTVPRDGELFYLRTSIP